MGLKGGAVCRGPGCRERDSVGSDIKARDFRTKVPGFHIIRKKPRTQLAPHIEMKLQLPRKRNNPEGNANIALGSEL